MQNTSELLKLAIQLNGKTIAGAEFLICPGRAVALLLHFTDGTSYRISPILEGPQMDQYLSIRVEQR